jgi:hypothetical protein
VLTPTRWSVATLIVSMLAGCASHYRGQVVDKHGAPVPYARVEGSGMHHAFPLGENTFSIQTTADVQGRFTLVTSDWPQNITATSPDSKRHGSVDLAVSQPPVVIVVR